MLNDQKPIVDAMQLDPGIFVLSVDFSLFLSLCYSAFYTVENLRYKDDLKTTTKSNFTTCKAYVG